MILRHMAIVFLEFAFDLLYSRLISGIRNRYEIQRFGINSAERCWRWLPLWEIRLFKSPN